MEVGGEDVELEEDEEAMEARGGIVFRLIPC